MSTVFKQCSCSGDNPTQLPSIPSGCGAMEDVVFNQLNVLDDNTLDSHCTFGLRLVNCIFSRSRNNFRGDAVILVDFPQRSI